MIEYTLGIRNIVIKVLVTIPPIKVIASGLKKLPPVINNGINPKIVVKLVSIIGLNRKYTASTQASCTLVPFVLCLEIYSTSKIPLFTVTPSKLTIPTKPVAVIGELNKTINKKLTHVKM